MTEQTDPQIVDPQVDGVQGDDSGEAAPDDAPDGPKTDPVEEPSE